MNGEDKKFHLWKFAKQKRENTIKCKSFFSVGKIDEVSFFHFGDVRKVFSFFMNEKAMMPEKQKR
jgi:hypothetical protein